jgi:hypothetical protein
MAPLRRPYPSVGEPESVPLQTYYEYECPSSSYTHSLSTSSAPMPHLHSIQTAPSQLPRQRLKRSHTYKDQTYSTRFSSSISQPIVTMSAALSTKAPKAHSNKSHSLSSSPSRRHSTQRVSTGCTANDSILARIMPRPTPIKSTTTTVIHTRQSSHSPAGKSEFDGLPRAARSVSLQPTPRPGPSKLTTREPPLASSSTSAETTITTTTTSTASTSTTSNETRHLRYETLEFTPEHERFGYIIRPRSSNGDCPDMSRSSSIVSFNRSSLFTPSERRPNTDCISYFPPYVGSDMHNEDEEGEEEVETGQEENREGRQSNHSRGSSLSAFASAIISVFRLSPKKNTIPLPDTADDSRPEDDTQTQVKPKGPIKLVPIPTAEWPCGSVRDKRRRDNMEEDGETMMLYPVKREGPRNKNDPDLEELESRDEVVESGNGVEAKNGLKSEKQVEEKVSTYPFSVVPSLTPQPEQTRSEFLSDLSLHQPQLLDESRHPMQSPPEVGLPPRAVHSNAFPYSEYLTPEEPSTTVSATRPASPTIQERIEVTKAKINKLKIKLARDPIEVIHKGINPAHIPTVHRVHRTRSHTRSESLFEDDDEISAGPSSGRKTREEYYGVSYRSSSQSSRTRRDEEYVEVSRSSSRLSSRSQTPSISKSSSYSNYLSSQTDSSMPPPRRRLSPTPSLSSIVTPTPSESGADDMEDPEQTPKAGRGGWIALQDAM